MWRDVVVGTDTQPDDVARRAYVVDVLGTNVRGGISTVAMPGRMRGVIPTVAMPGRNSSGPEHPGSDRDRQAMIHAGTLAASLASPTATVNRDAVPRPPTAPPGNRAAS